MGLGTKKDIPDSVEFKKWTRKQKKKAIVTYNGKRYKVMDYIALVAKSLPAAKNKTTGKPINHNQVMRTLYMREGIKEVENYRAMIADVTVEQLGLVNINEEEKKNDTD